MTYKNIKFGESEVMRSFERMAVKKGLVKLDPIKKEAAVEKFAAVGDLQTDLLTLINGLHKKGFVKEANQLEDKVVIFIRTAKEKTIIEQAHPEGEVEIADAGEMGKIETQTTQHDKIMKVLKNQPTGKTAAAEHLIVSVADLLNVDLRKFAQEEPAKEPTITPGGEAPPVPAVDEPKKKELTYFSDRQDKINQRIDEINQVVATDLKEVSSKISDIVNSVPVKSLSFTPEGIIASIKAGGEGQYQLYTQLSQVKPNVIGAYMLAASGAYGSDTDPRKQQEHAWKQISQLNLDNVKVYLDNISPGIFEKNFGSVVSDWEKVKSVFDRSKLTNTLNEVNAVVQAKKEAAFGAIDRVNTSLQTEIGKAISELLVVQKNINEFPTLVKSVDDSNSKLVGEKGALSQLLLQLNSIKLDPKRLDQIISTFKIGDGLKSIKELSDKVNMLIVKVKGMPITANDIYPSVKEIEGLVARFNRMGTQLTNYLSGLNENDPKYKEEVGFLGKLAALRDSIKNSKNKPVNEMIKEVSNILPDIKSYQDLLRVAGLWEEYYNKLASRKNELIKQAKPPSAAAPGVNPVKTPGAPVARPKNVPTADNVKKMQQALSDLGEAYSKAGGTPPEQITVLKNSGIDGIWGDRTKKAIEVANQLLQQTMPTTPQSPDSAEAVYSLLTKAMSGTGAIEAVLDRLPAQKIDWTNYTEPTDTPDNPVKLMDSNLSSLDTFATWLIKNGLESPVQAGATDMAVGKEGLKLGTMDAALRWFARHSKTKYDRYKESATLEKSKQLAISMNQSVNRLYSDLTKVYSGYLAQGYSIQDVHNMVVPLGGFTSLIGGEGSLAPGMGGKGGRGQGEGSTYGQKPGERGGRDLEGRSGRTGRGGNQTVPISDHIDLSNPVWGSQYQAIIRLSDLYQPAQTVAGMYFGDVQPYSQEQLASTVFNNLGYSGYQDFRNKLSELQRNDPNRAAAESQRLNTAYAQVKSMGPMNALAQALMTIKQQMPQVFNQWYQSLSPKPVEDETDRMLNLRQQWVKLIDRKLSEIADWRSGR